jgi:hypothetical protein
MPVTVIGYSRKFQTAPYEEPFTDVKASPKAYPFILHEMIFGKTTLSLIQWCNLNGSISLTPAAAGMDIDADFILKLTEILLEDC